MCSYHSSRLGMWTFDKKTIWSKSSFFKVQIILKEGKNFDFINAMKRCRSLKHGQTIKMQ